MKLTIKPLMDKKNISRYQLAHIMDVTYPTVDNMYKGKTSSIKLEILEKLCNSLDCTPNDILILDNKWAFLPIIRAF